MGLEPTTSILRDVQPTAPRRPLNQHVTYKTIHVYRMDFVCSIIIQRTRHAIVRLRSMENGEYESVNFPL